MNFLEKYGVCDRYINEASMYPHWKLGRIVAQYKGFYKIVTDNKEGLGKISGKVRYETDELAKMPAVGDFVMVDACDGEWVIHKVLTRKSVFLRRAVGVVNQAQVVASNIDTVFICMSMNKNYNLSRLERYVAIGWDSGAVPVVVLTKADLCEDVSTAVSEVEEASGFCDVIAVSMFDDGGYDAFDKYVKQGKTVAFIGSSGVGKSTLINRLLGDGVIATGEIGKGDKGKHTTTGREMFCCKNGGVVIDTPGMRELGAVGADVAKGFVDIEEIVRDCRFANCTHTNEPGCAVRQAIADGVIDERRLENYFKLKHEADYEGLTSKEIETKKFERMFKDVGGMKNARRFAKNKK